jgi:hypothetical protein
MLMHACWIGRVFPLMVCTQLESWWVGSSTTIIPEAVA